MDLSLFDYELPEGYIAYHPAKQRDWSRLMVLDRQTGEISHQKFSRITDYLNEGDGLVINDTRVFKARLYVRRETGGKIETMVDISPSICSSVRSSNVLSSSVDICLICTSTDKSWRCNALYACHDSALSAFLMAVRSSSAWRFMISMGVVAITSSFGFSVI